MRLHLYCRCPTWAAASALLWSSSVSASWLWAAFRSWWWTWTHKCDQNSMNYFYVRLKSYCPKAFIESKIWDKTTCVLRIFMTDWQLYFFSFREVGSTHLMSFHAESGQIYMTKKMRNRTDLVSPVHPVAVCECHGGLSSAVYFPLSGYIHYLPSQTGNTLTESMNLNRKPMKQEEYSTTKPWQK